MLISNSSARRATAVAGGFMALLLMSGCNNNTPPNNTAMANSPGGKRYKIGFANLTEKIPFGVRVREGIERAAKKAGNIDLVTADNNLDGATALSNADIFITQQVDGVIEFQTDEKMGDSIMEKFNAKKIPVIAIDIPLPGATFFGVNNYTAGHMAGEGLGKWIKKNWNGQVDALIMLELPQSGAIPQERLRGEREGLEAVVGKIPEGKVRHLDSKNTTAESQAKVKDTLTTLPNARHIAVVCINDDSAQGAIVAAEGAGRKNHIAVTAVDGGDIGRDEIRKPGSPQKGSTASFPEKYGDKLIPAMLKLLQGEKLPPKLFTDHVFLTADNIDRYYPRARKP